MLSIFSGLIGDGIPSFLGRGINGVGFYRDLWGVLVKIPDKRKSSVVLVLKIARTYVNTTACCYLRIDMKFGSYRDRACSNSPSANLLQPLVKVVQIVILLTLDWYCNLQRCIISADFGLSVLMH